MMEEIQADRSASGQPLNATLVPQMTETEGLNQNGGAFPPSSALAFVDAAASPAVVAATEALHAGRRCREHGSPRTGHSSRECSGERDLGGVSAPCGIMKVGTAKL